MTAAANLAHLPDACPELAAAADISVVHEGTALPLHSQVLAAGSRVLRTAFYGGGADDDTRAVAVALHGSSLDDARSFLRLVYTPSAVRQLSPTPDSLKGVLTLAHKLDAPEVMEACDIHLEGTVDGSWADWLLLADAYSMQRLVVKASEHLLKDMLSSAESWRTAALRLQGLGPHTLGMLLDMTHTAVRHRYPHDSFTPDSLSIWRKPGGA